jgi:hypothetical protein
MRTGTDLICLLRILRTGGEAELTIDRVERYLVSNWLPAVMRMQGVEYVPDLLTQVIEVVIDDKVNASDYSWSSIACHARTSLKFAKQAICKSPDHALPKVFNQGRLHRLPSLL